MLEYNSLSYLLKIAYIFQYLQIIVATIGIFGNVLTFLVYLRKRLRVYSFSLYIKTMTITDTIILLHSFRHWWAFIGQANLDLVAPFFCSFDEYQSYSATMISLSLLTLISLDRLITVAFPNRFKILKNLYFKIAMILSAVVYSLLLFIDMPLNYTVRDIGPRNSTIKLCLMDTEHNQRVSWINLANLLFINVFLNNVLNVFMVLALFKSRKKITRANDHTYKRDRRFAINSIGLNMVSTFCKLLFSVFLLVDNLIELDIIQIQLLFSVTLFFINIDSSASFFINMIVNSVFYEEFSIGFKSFF